MATVWQTDDLQASAWTAVIAKCFSGNNYIFLLSAWSPKIQLEQLARQVLETIACGGEASWALL
jgi:hypothetical protein